MSLTERSSPWQFSLRWLFALVAGTGVCALVASRCGYVEATGVGVSLILIAASIRIPRFRWSIFARIAICISATIVLWFAAVDFSWFIFRCTHCHLDRNQLRIRVFHVPIGTQNVDHNRDISEIAEDLGVSCEHSFDGWHKYRFWGLVFCWRPCIHGTTGLAWPEWYDEQMRERVRRIAEQDPNRGNEFHDEVLIKQNFAYFRTFVAEIKAMEDP